MIELGLNLPEAAERLRTAVEVAERPAGEALPTVTLAGIYAAQGHRDRAIATLRRVLEREPEHSAARALLAQLDAGAYPAEPQMPPEVEEPAAAASDPESTSTSTSSSTSTSTSSSTSTSTSSSTSTSTSTSIVEANDSPDGLVVRWESRDATLARLAAAFPDGRGVLRILLVVPTWDGPRSELRDLEVEARSGERVLRGLPAGVIVRAAVGWRTAEGFAPIAHV